MDGYLNHEQCIWNNTFIRDSSITVKLCSNYCNNIAFIRSLNFYIFDHKFRLYFKPQ